jgi:hypothetical protein
MNTKMAASLITSIMTFLQMHSEKKATTAKTSSAATTAKMQLQSKTGILSLPNQCVREENMGSGMVIAINVENPNLFEWAYNAMLKAPRPSLPLPEVLAAIMPSSLVRVYVYVYGGLRETTTAQTWHVAPTTHYTCTDSLARFAPSPSPTRFTLLLCLSSQNNQISDPHCLSDLARKLSTERQNDDRTDNDVPTNTAPEEDIVRRKDSLVT